MTVIGAIIIGAVLVLTLRLANKKLPTWVSILIIVFYSAFFIGIGIYASLD